jgi:ATP-dependent protease HslVU (ClpYQ) ATPase subunit
MRILKEPEFNLIFQQKKLLEAEEVDLVFTEDVEIGLCRLLKR